MSGDESFLPRWSRRKRSAAATARQSAKPENAADNAAPKTPEFLPLGGLIASNTKI